MIRSRPDEGPRTECSTIYRSTGAFAIVTCSSCVLSRNGWRSPVLYRTPTSRNDQPGSWIDISAICLNLRQVKIIARIINNAIRNLLYTQLQPHSIGRLLSTRDKSRLRGEPVEPGLV